MSEAPLRVAALGMGWWSDVLADAIKRSDKLEIVACFTRSAEKRSAFAAKYSCRAAASYEEILDDPSIEAVINTTPNNVHLETTEAAAKAGKHVFLDKPIANTVREGQAIADACKAGRRRAGARLSAPAREPLPLDQGRDRCRPLRQAGAGRVQHQPRPARPLRPLVLALHRGRHAGRRDAADRHPLRRRAGVPDGPGQERVGAAGAARASRRQPGRGQHDLASTRTTLFPI